VNIPDEHRIAKVMQETSMDRVQAIRHIQQRDWLKTLPNRLG
jgi:hypothetical protein